MNSIVPCARVLIWSPQKLQEQLLDAQDRLGEIEELSERQREEIAALKARLASQPASMSGIDSSDAAVETLKQRNQELEKACPSFFWFVDLVSHEADQECFVFQQCREYRTILANEDQATALRSERRLAAREWSEKLHHIQRDLDKARTLRDQAVLELGEERKKTDKLEKALLRKGMGDILHSRLHGEVNGQSKRRRSGSLDGLSLLASESPVRFTY